jgi:LEA14-like dessication related protein
MICWESFLKGFDIMNANRYVVGVIAIVSVFFVGCETMQQTFSLSKPSARMTGLNFEDVSLDSATLLFDVEVDNPYSVALPLLSMDYDISSGASPFLSGSSDLQTTVPARSKKIVSLPVSVNYLDMLKSLKGITPGSKIPYEAVVNLSIDAQVLGDLKLPLKKTGEVDLPTVSSESIKNIWDVINSK